MMPGPSLIHSAIESAFDSEAKTRPGGALMVTEATGGDSAKVWSFRYPNQTAQATMTMARPRQPRIHLSMGGMAEAEGGGSSQRCAYQPSLASADSAVRSCCKSERHAWRVAPKRAVRDGQGEIRTLGTGLTGTPVF